MKNIIKIQEEVAISQDGKRVILEKGDRVKILENNLITKNGWIFKSGNRGYKNRPATLEKEIGYVHYLTIIYYGEGTLLQLKDENMDGETIYKEFSNVEELSSFLNKKYKNNITINEDDLSYFDIFVKESLFKKDSNTICIEEETTINKKGKKIILEKGDRIKIIQEKSKAYQKYLDFVDKEGHITASASSVFEDWIDKEGKSLSLDDIKNALDDLWPRTDSDSKFFLIDYAERKGIK